MSIPWMHMLNSLVPDFDVLTRIMENGSIVEVRTVKRPVGLDMIIVDESSVLESFDKTLLTEIVEWSSSQLEKHPGCNRIGWDTWYFNDIESYQKFMTMYYLKWQA